MVTRQDLDRARGRTGKPRMSYPGATAVRYDRELGYVVVSFGADLDLAIKPEDVEGLGQVAPGELARVEIAPSGLALHFPGLASDLYLPPLLRRLRKPWHRRER
jgi:hypothetical protein